MTHDEKIIQEATEAVTKGYPCAFYVPQLLEVIKNKEAEIFNLNKEISALKLKNNEFLKSNEKAKAEIERLNVELEFKCDNCENIRLSRKEYRKAISQAKSEAYREFAKSLEEKAELGWVINGCQDYAVSLDDINTIYKELTKTTDQTATNQSVSLIDGHIEE